MDVVEGLTLSLVTFHSEANNNGILCPIQPHAVEINLLVHFAHENFVTRVPIYFHMNRLRNCFSGEPANDALALDSLPLLNELDVLAKVTVPIEPFTTRTGFETFSFLLYAMTVVAGPRNMTRALLQRTIRSE